MRGPRNAGEPVAVGEHDELGAVARVELRHRPADVRAHGRLADVPALGDLLVRQPLGDERHDVAFARREQLDHAGIGFRASDAGASLNAAISRRVTPGDNSASPAATTRTARISSAGSVCFTRNPLAPARSASYTYSSSSNVVSTSTFTSARSSRAGDLAGRGQPVDLRHADVHQHDVGEQFGRERDRLGAVAGLADDFDVVLGVEQGAEPGAHQHLVVGEQHADRHGHHRGCHVATTR